MSVSKSYIDVWTGRHPDSHSEFIEDIHAGSLRPVLFVFYFLETVFNMFCMAYHIIGFHSIDTDMFGWEEQAIHFFYLITFYVFMVLTFFQSINLCTGHKPTITMELTKACAAAIAFVGISLTTMWDAERQFYMFETEPKPEDRPGLFINYMPVHPFFYYMRGQSICSLACGLLYMLHAVIMLDFKLTSAQDDDYMPIPLFVFGRWVHGHMEKYQWFREFSSNDKIYL